MRKIILTLVAVMCLAGSQAAKVTATQPATTFAIVIDATTYDKCRAEVEAYRDALTNDGLAVCILSNEWSSPDQVREALISLNKSSKKLPLEGCVFIGDVPFVSVQNAQHMTTAFKMNEERLRADADCHPSAPYRRCSPAKEARKGQRLRICRCFCSAFPPP